MYKVIKLTEKGMLVAKGSNNEYQMGNEAIGYALNPHNNKVGDVLPATFAPIGSRQQAGTNKKGEAITLTFWVFQQGRAQARFLFVIYVE